MSPKYFLLALAFVLPNFATAEEPEGTRPISQIGNNFIATMKSPAINFVAGQSFVSLNENSKLRCNLYLNNSVSTSSFQILGERNNLKISKVTVDKSEINIHPEDSTVIDVIKCTSREPYVYANDFTLDQLKNALGNVKIEKLNPLKSVKDHSQPMKVDVAEAESSTAV